MLISPWRLARDEPFARAARQVEWLSALIWLQAPDDTAPAHPAPCAKVATRLEADAPLAVGLVALLGGVSMRDQVIKRLVRTIHGSPPPAEPGDELAAALVDELDRIDRELGPTLSATLSEAWEQVQQVTEGLFGGTDPAASLVAVLREPITTEVGVAPLTCLPPPQDGRHGVAVPDGRPGLQLYFGVPVGVDPRMFGIDAQFVNAGVWHYHLGDYLRRHWPAVARALAPMDAVASAFAGSLRPDRRRSWPDAAEQHLRLALRSHLAEHQGARRAHFELLAQAFGAPHFGWFAAWLDDHRSGDRPLADRLTRLPADLAAAVAGGELTDTTVDVPRAINLTLIHARQRGLHLVVPDDWDDELIAWVRRGWQALHGTVVRHQTWAASSTAAGPCAVAFGSAADNPIVAEVLQARGLTTPSDATEVLAVLALTAAGWHVALAAAVPATAAAVPLELMTRLTCSYARLRRGRVVEADGVTGGL